jgi:hypothetical protein
MDVTAVAKSSIWRARQPITTPLRFALQGDHGMTRRYRIAVAGASVALLVAIGGIAAAEQGGESETHRHNPTTTTTTPSTTTTVVTTIGDPQVDEPDGLDPELGDEEPVGVEVESNRLAALCHALNQGSEQGQAMKAEHGQAFQDLECTDAAPVAGGESQGDPEADAGPPPWSNAGGGGTGQEHGNSGQGGGANKSHAGNAH